MFVLDCVCVRTYGSFRSYVRMCVKCSNGNVSDARNVLLVLHSIISNIHCIYELAIFTGIDEIHIYSHIHCMINLIRARTLTHTHNRAHREGDINI